MTDTLLFDRLKQDHDRHRTMLAEIGGTTEPAKRKSLLDAFRIEVTAHAAAEEETLRGALLAAWRTVAPPGLVARYEGLALDP